MSNDLERAKCLIKFMDYDYATEGELDVIVSIEDQISEKNWVSKAQLTLLENINERINLRDTPIRRL